MFGRFGILLVLLVTGLSLIRSVRATDHVHYTSSSVGIGVTDVDTDIAYGEYPFEANGTGVTYITAVRLRDANHKPIIGLDLQLECYVQREGQPKSSNYSWSHNNVKLARVEGKKSSILTIRRLKQSDDGNYTCTIANEAGEGAAGNYFPLTVGTFPVVSLTGPNQPITALNRNENLTCTVSATPLATITWYLNDQPIGIINSTKYTIADPGAADKGLYKCKAENSIGTAVAVLYVEVFYAPVGKPTVQPNIQAIVANTTTKFSCNIDSLENHGNPKATRFTWDYNNEKLEDQKITIYQSSINDEVQLSCSMVNYYKGSEASSTVNLTVEAPVLFESPPVPPENETEFTYTPDREDGTFEINYIISGTEVMEINLYRNSSHDNVVTNKDFTKTEATKKGNFSFEQKSAKEVAFKWNLDIDGLKELDDCSRMKYFDGLYTLIALGMAAGSQSEATTRFKIAAKFKPTWHGPTTLYVDIGQELQINCSICANPEPLEYKWDFNSGALGDGVQKENGNRNLRIKSVEDTHYGYYGCEVGTKKFRITVEPAPKGGLSSGVIAGIVIGGIVVLAIIVGVIILFVRRKRTPDHSKESLHHTRTLPTKREVNNGERGDPHELQPSTSTTPQPAVEGIAGPCQNVSNKPSPPSRAGIGGPYENVPNKPPAPSRTVSKKPQTRGQEPPQVEEDGTDNNIYDVIDHQDGEDYENIEKDQQDEYTVPIANPYTREPSSRF